ncbi:MAG: pilus assembly protein [Lautropia sp.]
MTDSTPARPALRRVSTALRRLRRIVIAIAWLPCLMVLSLVAPGSALAQSAIAQKPLTAQVSPASNVMLMIDDSGSMQENWLPPIAGFDFATLVATGFDANRNVDIANQWGGGTTSVPAWDVRLRVPFMNPISYNPTVTYKPWNDDNKPLASNFPPADVGGYDGGGNFVGGTRNDMRRVTVAGVRTPVDTSVAADLFRRPAGTRNGSVCLATGTRPRQNCVVDATVDIGYVCTPDPTATESYCTTWNQVPRPIEARYYRFMGPTWAERHDIGAYRLVEIDRDAPTQTYPVPIDPQTGAATTRSDCAAGTWCTFAEEAQNYANWYTYYRTRLFGAIAVTAETLAGLSAPMRLGYGRINYFASGPGQWPQDPASSPGPVLPNVDGQPAPGHVVRGVRDFTPGSTPRAEVFDWLFQLKADGWTPNREALDAVGRYFSRGDPAGPWSSNPGTGPGGGTADLACRRSYAILATDGGWNNGGGLPAIGASGGPWGAGPRESDGVVGPLIAGSGSQAGRNYRYDPATDSVFGGALAATADTFTDVAHFYWSRDLRADLPNLKRPIPWATGGSGTWPGGDEDPSTWQNLSTMIIGYGLSSPWSSEQVRSAMKSGGTIPWPGNVTEASPDWMKVHDTQRAAMASRGDFYTATSATELGDALSSAFARVQAQRASAASLSVSNAVITSVDDLVFEAGYTAGEWTGSLRALEALQLLAGNRVERWQASLPAASARRIVTTAARNAAVDFEWATLATAQQAALGSAQIVDYLRGDATREKPSGPLRPRKSALGSIVHSAPLYSKATNHNYQSGPTAGGTGYATWLETKRTSRRASVMINANDGMMHAFDAQTGVELFAFVPRATIGRLADLASPSYDHFYLVDGALSEGDVHLGGAWKTVVVGVGGAGPRSMFALDVTDPTAFGTGKVLFDLDASDVPDLGHVMGRALIASTKAGKWVAIVGNGYESADHRAKLLVVDLADGSVLRTIDTGVGADAAGQRNGLGPVTPIYDLKRDVVGLYAGDKLGNVWKFDLSSSNASNWKIARVGAAPAAPLFTATDPSGNPQPITTEIRVSTHPLGGRYLSFGTGKHFETVDAGDTAVQSIYMLRDLGNTVTIVRSDLQQAVLADVSGGFRSLSWPTAMNWATKKGWYLNLVMGGTAGGERIVATPVASGGKVSFTSFRPTSTDPCDSNGTSHLYVFDLASGLTRPAFEGETADIVGRRLDEGVLGGNIPLYAPVAGGPMVNQIDASSLSGMSDATVYSLTGTTVTKGASGSACASGATSIGQSAMAVPTSCSGTLPLRVWRDLR